MGTQNALTPLDPADYVAIEAAVLETARGRWFLTEYARRNRNADTALVLDALAKLQTSLTGDETSRQLEKVRNDLSEMAAVIERTKSEVASLRPDGESIRHFEEAALALDSVVKTTEKATSDILEAAEHIQEAAWTLREIGADGDQCDIIDRRATDIYTACTFQDLTAQRTKKVVHTLTYLESRINAMIDTWKTSAAEALAMADKPPPIFEDESLSQDAVDGFVDDDSIAFDGNDRPFMDAQEMTGPEVAPPAPIDLPDTDRAGPSRMGMDSDDASLPEAAGAPFDDTVDVSWSDRSAEPSPEPGHQAAADARHGDDDADPLADFDDDEDDDDLVFVERHPMQDGAAAASRPAADAMAEIDMMPPAERLRRFT